MAQQTTRIAYFYKAPPHADFLISCRFTLDFASVKGRFTRNEVVFSLLGSDLLFQTLASLFLFLSLGFL